MSEEKKTGMRKGAFAVRCIDSVLLAGLALFFFLNPSFYQNKPADADTAVIHAGRIVYVLVLSAGGFAAVWMPNPLKGKVKDRVGILLSFLTMPLVVFPLEYANIRTHMLPPDVFVMIGEKKLLLTGAVIFLFFCKRGESCLAATPAALFSGKSTGISNVAHSSCGKIEVDQPTCSPFAAASIAAA